MHQANASLAAFDQPLLPEGHDDLLPQRPLLNRMVWAVDSESAWRRWLGLATGLLVTLGFALFISTYTARGPGSPGIDENAYLVAGKNIAHYGQVGLHPAEPFGYVGPMWFRAADGWYYPKYPVGVPMLNALAIWASGGHNNAAYLVSPACATLAVLGLFLLGRALAGSFFGALGALVLATNSTHLHLAIIPSSHAPAVMCAVWGMYLLICWCRGGKAWQGALAGFVLGCTVTMRYSEGLLGLPLGMACLWMINWKTFWVDALVIVGAAAATVGLIWGNETFLHHHWISYTLATLWGLALIAWCVWRFPSCKTALVSMIPILGWVVPVAALTIFNLKATGHLTGYDSTNESSGFTLLQFQNKWESTVAEMSLYGLFLIFPLGIVGMLMLPGKSLRLGLILLLWFLPGAVLYTAYYWGQQSPGVGYLRFFLTLFPPLIAAAMWLLSEVMRRLSAQEQAEARFEPGTLHPAAKAFLGCIAGGLTGALCGYGLRHLFEPQANCWIVYDHWAWYGSAVGAIVGICVLDRPGRGALAAGALVAAIAVAGVYVEVPDLSRQFEYNANVAFSARMLALLAPASHHQNGKPDPVYFCDDSGMFARLLMQMQFEGDGVWYADTAFDPESGRRGGIGGGAGRMLANQQADPDRPVLIDPERTKLAHDLYAKLSLTDLQNAEKQVIATALDAGQPVYILASAARATEMKLRLKRYGFNCSLVGQWREPVNTTEPDSQNQPGNGNNIRNNFRRTNRFGGPGGPGGRPGGGPGGMFGGSLGLAPPMRGFRINDEPQSLQLLQVARTPATAPAH